MSSNFLINIVRFWVFLSLQIVVFNRFEVFGITAFPYLLFIVFYPVNANRYGLLFWSFLLGLAMDMFLDSGGIHSASCLVLAFFKHQIFGISYGLSYYYQTIKVTKSSLKEQFWVIGFCALVHHSVLFFLEAFSFTSFGETLLKIVFSSIFTVVFSLFLINLFKISKK